MKAITTFFVVICLIITNVSLGQTQGEKKKVEISIFPNPANPGQTVTVKFSEPVELNSLNLFQADGWKPASLNLIRSMQTQFSFPVPSVTSSGVYPLGFVTRNKEVLGVKLVIMEK